MNNVNVIENNQQISVNLIAYFSDNNINYLFYTKNETVQDGLIKMYVAKENLGTNATITDDEWTNLKKIMQGIIMGNININYINYSNPINLNESRAIALRSDNLETLKNTYNSSLSANAENGGTNKDLLNQSFGVEAPVNQINTPVLEVNETPNIEISPIPDVQNNLNLENTPVNLNTEVDNNVNVNEPVNAPFEPINNEEKTLNTDDSNDILSINSIKPISNDASVINANNDFKVSNEPNIFDQVRNEDTIGEVNVGENSIKSNNTNEREEIKTSFNNSSLIELNERKIKLFEELADIYREENKLLNEDSNDLDKTASDLFNNNGTLNENNLLDN